MTQDHIMSRPVTKNFISSFLTPLSLFVIIKSSLSAECEVRCVLDNSRQRSCVSDSLRCNGIRDCTFGEDEKLCADCSPTAFRCSSSQETSTCIPQANVCDGMEDCQYGDDEANCYDCIRRCPMSTFLKPLRRIKSELNCDGKTDCPCGDDEDKCLKSKSVWSWLGPFIPGALCGICCLSFIVNVWRTYKRKARPRIHHITRHDLVNHRHRNRTRSRGRSVRQETVTISPVTLTRTISFEEDPPPYNEVVRFNNLTGTVNISFIGDAGISNYTETRLEPQAVDPPPYSSVTNPKSECVAHIDTDEPDAGVSVSSPCDMTETTAGTQVPSPEERSTDPDAIFV